MRVLYPQRVVEKNVGGNTTYTRRIMEGVRAKGADVGLIPALPHASLTACSETASGLRRQQDTVLHFTADTGPVFRTRTPSVLTVHGVASRWINVARNVRQEAIWRTRVKAAIRSVDRVLTVSSSSAQDVAEVFEMDPAALTVIPHGIDTARFGQSTPLSPELAEFENAEFALFVGNLEPRKNIAELVKAFGRPELRSQAMPLLIVGRPAWNYTAIMATIAESPWVKHLGFVSESDKIALMQRCRLFLFPSLYEGFGFPVLEALAAGAAVACSRRGSLAEVAGPSLVLEDLDAAGIAARVSEILSDDESQARCREQGLEWARSFSWERSIDAHLKVYEELCQR